MTTVIQLILLYFIISANSSNEVSVGSAHLMSPEITTHSQEAVTPSDLLPIDIPKLDTNVHPSTVEKDSFITPSSEDERLPANIFATPSSVHEEGQGERKEENSVEEESDLAMKESSSEVVLPSKEKRTLVSQRDATSKEKRTMVSQRDATSKEKRTMVSQRDATSKEKRTMVSQRDATTRLYM